MTRIGGKQLQIEEIFTFPNFEEMMIVNQPIAVSSTKSSDTIADQNIPKVDNNPFSSWNP